VQSSRSHPGDSRAEPSASHVGSSQRGDVAAEPPAETVERLHELSYYLDDLVRIPGTNYRVGLDPAVSLLPVVGDTVSAVLSAYVVVEAAALGVPRETLLRMLLNLFVDATLGSIPVVGDLFDAVWKANARNVALLETRRRDPGGVDTDRRFLFVAVGAVAAVVLAAGLASTLAVWWLLGRFGVL
jgi:hypothetical protein